MGYRDVSGVVLQRRDLFENDQEVVLLTEDGGIEARAPHARKSQKTFCGRLEPPNAVSARLYRSRDNARWIVSDMTIETVYADLMRDEDLRYRLWPLLALYRDLFPEGEQPRGCLPHLHKALQYLTEGFSPALLVTDRVLVRLAARTGVAFETDRCTDCRRPLHQVNGNSGRVLVTPCAGMICPACSREESDRSGQSKGWNVRPGVLDLYGNLMELTWGQVCARDYPVRAMQDLEELLYKLFRYHFEISLDTLKIRKSL